MRLLAVFEDSSNGSTSEVHAVDDGYLVQFFDHRHVRMDASDFRTMSRSEAFNHAGEQHPDVVRIS